MKKSILTLTILAAIFLISNNSTSLGQKVNLGIGGGFLLPLSDFGSSYNTGYRVGANLFYQVSEKYSFGGLVSYNFFPAASNDASYETSGGLKVIKINPSFRYCKDKESRVFLQAGGVLFIWDKNFTEKGLHSTYTYLGEGKDFGVNVGGGVKIGNMQRIHFEINPLLNFIFLSGETSIWASVNLNLSIPL
jgi:hypothetical protein